MKYIKHFNEALKPSQFRRYVKAFDRNRYEDIFQKLKQEYSGDKNAYRIYVPVVEETKENPIEKEVRDYLLTQDTEITNYRAGKCRRKGAKNESKIGQLLTRLKQNELMNKFVSDPERKIGKESLMVCLSRHPYDIAGADTDRTWTNCMTMATTDNRFTKSLIEKRDKIQKELNKHRAYLSVLELEVEEMDLDEDADEKERERIEAQIEEYSVKHDFVKLEEEIEELNDSIDGRTETGSNAKYLMQDVKKGSLIAYLIKESDKNIQNPIANWNIKPFKNKENETDIILVADAKGYGEKTTIFKNTIDMILDKINGNKSDGIYCLVDRLYDDGLNKVFKMNSDNVMDRIRDADENFDIESYVKMYVNGGKYDNIVDVVNSIALFVKKNDYDSLDLNDEMIVLLTQYLSKTNDSDKVTSLSNAFSIYYTYAFKSDRVLWYETISYLFYELDKIVEKSEHKDMALTVVSLFGNELLKKIITSRRLSLSKIIEEYLSNIDSYSADNTFNIKYFDGFNLKAVRGVSINWDEDEGFRLDYKNFFTYFDNDAKEKVEKIASAFNIKMPIQEDDNDDRESGEKIIFKYSNPSWNYGA